jgi:hypothetical protein
VADSMKEIAELSKTPAQKARDKQNEATKKATEDMIEQKKVRDEIARKAEEQQKEMQRQLEATRRHAEQLTKSLRLPDEIYRDAIMELKDLAAQDFLSDDVVSRGMEKAKEDLRRALDTGKDAAYMQDQRVGAAERYTMAGYSAVQSARQSQDNAAKAALEKSAKNSEFLKYLESIDKGISDKPAVTFMVSSL